MDGVALEVPLLIHLDDLELTEALSLVSLRADAEVPDGLLRKLHLNRKGVVVDDGTQLLRLGR